MVGPITLTQVYHYFAQGQLGYPFFGSASLLSGALLCIAIIPLVWGTRRLQELDQQNENGSAKEPAGAEPS